MNVVVTGAAGHVGQVLCLGLADRGHGVVGVDLLPPPEGYDGAWHTADCTDIDAVLAVIGAQPLDAVVHLAGNAGEASLPDQLTSHAVSTAALVDAMVEHGIGRIVYASSNHAVGHTPRAAGEQPVAADAPPRPDTFYGVAKVAAEAVLRLAVDRHGLDAVVCRIGTCAERPTSRRALATWLSHDDCVRMAEAALTTPAPGYAVLWGISANTRAWWDLESGRRLGYEPVDDAERYADSVPTSPTDAAEVAVVGGAFASARFVRPALDRG
jgi:uronate dehydrogenase